MNNNRITVAYGDGIGPEIMEATLQILRASNANLTVDVIEIGKSQYEKNYETGIPPDAWETIKNNNILLKAPITTPQGKGYRSLNVTLRKTLELHANIRPIKSYHPFIQTNFPNLDIVVIRENGEDLYSGIEYRLSNDTYESLKIITETGCRKIIKHAFDYALNHNRKKITCIVKDNIMKLTDGTFHRVFNEISKYYPEIETEQMIVDIATAKIASNPEAFDMIVTLNLYGDIISDVTAEISGSVGIGGSANIGNNYAMFEAIHGSAPDIAGQDIANPTGLINASIMMLNHLKLFKEAAKIQNALNATIEDGIHTADLYNSKNSTKKVGTKEFADEVIKRLGKTPKKFTIASNNNENTASRNIEFSNKKSQSTLVGVDIYIPNQKYDDIEIFHNDLQKAIKDNLLQIQSISYNGIKLWPNDKFKPTFGDYLCCRFVSKNPDKIVAYSNVIDLLNLLEQENIKFLKLENLYLYDGQIGFSK